MFMTKQEMLKFVLLRSIGNFLVLFALFGVVATFGPAISTEATYRIAQARGIEYTIAAPQNDPERVDGGFPGQGGERVTPAPQNQSQRQHEGPTFGSVLAGPKEQVLVPPDTEFSIIIPKIGASAKIFPNVDPENENEFLPILQEGIAHAKGTVFPGMAGNTYLFAHSTDNWWNVGRYNAVFYLLKDLNPGDEVIVFFEGRRFNYVVSEKKTAASDDVSYLRNSQGGPERLVMQTCWPPGTTWQRIFVTAVPKAEVN